jgi:DNA replication and repair protein RecF
MYLSSLTIKNYRSYAHLAVKFDDGINILQGENAAGKTNVLEAIGFLSFGKSFRTQKDADCIKQGEDTALIEGTITKAQGSLTVESVFMRDGKKSLKVNGEPARRMGELFGNFIAVVFSPEDLKVLKESPSLRRRFVDMEISKLKPAYFFDLQEYNKVMMQKNALLKMRISVEKIGKLAAVYNEQLSEYGEKIIVARKAFLERLDAESAKVHAHLSSGEVLSLKYRCSVGAENIKAALYDKLQSALNSEIEQGFCLYGPHREDIAVSIDGDEVKAFSSQGQIRTAMLSLKLATLGIAKADFDELPVLLLDDVFSELDQTRQKALLEYAGGVQCFITSAVPVKSKIGSIYAVANGDVKKES